MSEAETGVMPITRDFASYDDLLERLLAVRKECEAMNQELILHRVVETYARDVTSWDWSDNDEECVADMEMMRKALDILDQHCRVTKAVSDATPGAHHDQ